jgi:hypothetical protein
MSIKGKEAYQKELIDRYIADKIREESTKSREVKYIARDSQRKTKKLFFKNFHEDIENYMK